VPLSTGDYVRGSRDTYRVDRLLCEGGMGRILLGDSSKGERVIVKEPRFLRDQDDPVRLEKLKVEGEILSSINHKNIVRFVDSRDGGMTYYLVLNYVPGKSMKDTYLKKPAGENETKRFALTLLGTLQYIHRMNIIHRDVNPKNILLPSDMVLLDFGAAKRGYTQVDPRVQLRFGHTIVGTPGWSAPEQFYGLVTERCDIYAVGATMFFLLTGHPPLMHRRSDGSVESPRRVNPRVSKEIAKVVLTALDSDPSNRYQIAEEMASEIRGHRIVGGAPCIFCKGKKHPVTKTLKIGRSPQCDVFIEDPVMYISRHHAEIYIEGGKYWIEDVGSKNGTFMYEKGSFQRINKRELQANDLVALCYSPQKGPYITLSFSSSA